MLLVEGGAEVQEDGGCLEDGEPGVGYGGDAAVRVDLSYEAGQGGGCDDVRRWSGVGERKSELCE